MASASEPSSNTQKLLWWCKSANLIIRFALLFHGLTQKSIKSTSFLFFSDDVDYTEFNITLITLFGWLKFEGSNRQHLRDFAQTGAEFVASFASRTTELSLGAYFEFPTKIELDLEVKHYVSELRDVATRNC